MRDTDDRKISRTIFLFSLAIHCLALGMPDFKPGVRYEERPPEENSVLLEIEKPPLLPRIDLMSEEKKIKDLERKEEPPEPERKQEPPPRDIEEVREEEVTLNAAPPPGEHAEERIEVPEPDEEAMLRYQDMIKQRIESCRKYPGWAKKRGFEGITYVKFTLSSNGMIENITLVRSSGFTVLDKEAVATVKRAMPFKPFPVEIKRSSLTMEVALVFCLN